MSSPRFTPSVPRFPHRGSIGKTIELDHDLADHGVSPELRSRVRCGVTSLRSECDRLERQFRIRERGFRVSRTRFKFEAGLLREELFGDSRGKLGSTIDHPPLSPPPPPSLPPQLTPASFRPTADLPHHYQPGSVSDSSFPPSDVLQRRRLASIRTIVNELQQIKGKFVRDRATRLSELRTQCDIAETSLRRIKILKDRFSTRLERLSKEETKAREHLARVTSFQTSLVEEDQQRKRERQILEEQTRSRILEMRERRKLRRLETELAQTDAEELSRTLNERLERRRQKLSEKVNRKRTEYLEIQTQMKNERAIIRYMRDKVKEAEGTLKTVLSEARELQEQTVGWREQISFEEERIEELEEIRQRQLSLREEEIEIEGEIISTFHISREEIESELTENETQIAQIDKQYSEYVNEFSKLSHSSKVVNERFRFYDEQDEIYVEQEDAPENIEASIEPPMGYVVIVFTDVQNSVELWESSVNVMKQSIALHHSLAHRLLQECEGYWVKTEGDAMMIAFASVKNAVRYSIMFQLQLLSLEWPEKLLRMKDAEIQHHESTAATLYRGLRVRIGINDGNPIVEKDPTTHRTDYFGPVVNKAARVEACALGGAIAVSDSVFQNLLPFLEKSGSEEEEEGEETNEIETFGSEIHVRELGKRQLKGVAIPEIIRILFPYQLRHRKLKPARFLSLAERIAELEVKEKELQLKKAELEESIKLHVRQKALESQADQQDSVIKFLKQKFENTKQVLQSREEQITAKEAAMMQRDVDEILAQSNVLSGECDQLRSNYSKVTSLFDTHFESQIGQYRGELALARSKLKRNKRRTMFNKQVWETEKALLTEKLNDSAKKAEERDAIIERLKAELEEIRTKSFEAEFEADVENMKPSKKTIVSDAVLQHQQMSIQNSRIMKSRRLIRLALDSTMEKLQQALHSGRDAICSFSLPSTSTQPTHASSSPTPTRASVRPSIRELPPDCVVRSTSEIIPPLNVLRHAMQKSHPRTPFRGPRTPRIPLLPIQTSEKRKRPASSSTERGGAPLSPLPCPLFHHGRHRPHSQAHSRPRPRDRSHSRHWSSSHSRSRSRHSHRDSSRNSRQSHRSTVREDLFHTLKECQTELLSPDTTKRQQRRILKRVTALKKSVPFLRPSSSNRTAVMPSSSIPSISEWTQPSHSDSVLASQLESSSLMSRTEKEGIKRLFDSFEASQKACLRAPVMPVLSPCRPRTKKVRGRRRGRGRRGREREDLGENQRRNVDGSRAARMRSRRRRRRPQSSFPSTTPVDLPDLIPSRARAFLSLSNAKLLRDRKVAIQSFKRQAMRQMESEQRQRE